ncbi:MAG: outer membrane beta-barrel protein [Bacteroidetes bacterium]|nr:outer membrane beta-barrel protein [Bacteroidota bacterium]
MINRLLLTLSIFLFGFISVTYSQALLLSGKIVNNKNEPIPGVTIIITDNKAAAISDVDGRYSLSLLSNKKYELKFSSIGYITKTITDVEVITDKVNELNVMLMDSSRNLDAVVVQSNRSSAKKESIASLISFQKNTSTVASVISAEAIRRSPDKNTSEALKRVPGTSIQEGKYLIVRGLADRYNQAMLNGVLLSSTEPDRKTFSFDIFPAAMIDNIIINKTFAPENPGEWAGGLVQVNTKDIPTTGFFKVEIGTNFNTNTIGKDFYTTPGSPTDWLGFDDGTRALPDGMPTKNAFAQLSPSQKIDFGKQIAADKWSVNPQNSPMSTLGEIFQASGGFKTSVLKKEIGGVIAVTYNRSIRNTYYVNKFYSILDSKAYDNFDYYNNKYSQEVLGGVLANFSIKLNADNRISFKNILNINNANDVTLRTGKDFEANSQYGENIRARELKFRTNTFFNTILSGEHNLKITGTKLNWFGSFNILDQYIPLQRRLQYNQDPTIINAPYLALLSNTYSQKSGSILYSMLSDYIYSAGGDVTQKFRLFSKAQTIKGGYLLQIKDRLYDSRPFAINLPSDNPTLRALDEDHIFSEENFGTEDNKFGFGELAGNQFRYLANSILNAGYLQFDNSFTNWLRVVWGARYENFDQLIGSVRPTDDRYLHTRVGDLLPSMNITFKLNNSNNIRLAGSQTLVRPEFRELSNIAFYDFEVGATFMGSKTLIRTKITNFDLRYENYPRAGEVFTFGIFYKYFANPIELKFNQSGAGSSNTFNYVNATSAKSYGAELEFRKKLDFFQPLRNFTLQGNFSYIYNRVRFENEDLDRPMQGQSPYLINAGLQYDLEKIGLNTTALFNVIGRRILYVGNEEVPAIWEAPRPLLDLQVAKKVLKNKGEFKLNISDILNQTAKFYHDLNNDKKFTNTKVDALALTRKYGTNISITFSYSIK